MIKREMAENTKSLTESLQFILEGFQQQSIDDQQDFLEFFQRVIRATNDKSRKKVLIKFSRHLEKEAARKFDAWLEAEMKG